LRKGERFAWKPQCEEAFQKLKEFLASPPILTRPKPGEQCFKIHESAMLKNTNLKNKNKNKNALRYMARL
jgi:hypothetical protein